MNVPQGKFALAWVGTEPLILDQGTHVIASPNLQEITERSLVDQSDFCINHGNIHMIRVPPGKVACITLLNQPYILECRREPYVFRNPLFSFNPVNDFADCGAPYIRNGSLHVLQVPKGKIATVWVGPKPVLVYHRNEPYVVLDNLFRLEARANANAKNRSSDDLFFSANTEIICHGSIKRIIPRTGHVAVVYQDGHLQVMHPTADGRPIIIDHERASVGEMLNVQKQTLRFPSEKTKREREKEYQGDDKKVINSEVFTTANGARYGVKLLVVFSVSDPQLALTNFKPDDIVPHIENLVVTEMNKAIQATESTSFLQTRARAQAAPAVSSDPAVPSAPVFYSSAQDEIKDHLCRDLLGVGISIDRVSIEESVPIDKAVIEQMANFAVRNKKITLEVALLEREAQIVEQQSRRVALQQRIARQTEYGLMVQRAQAELEAARLKAEASNVLSAAYQQQLAMLDSVYKKYPALLQLQLAETMYCQAKPLGFAPLAPVLDEFQSDLSEFTFKTGSDAFSLADDGGKQPALELGDDIDWDAQQDALSQQQQVQQPVQVRKLKEKQMDRQVSVVNPNVRALVDMGFEPTAAKDAFARFNDINKAVKFLASKK